MAKEYIEIECTPYNESCVQVSKNDYMPAMRAEANKYLNMLRARFPNCDKVTMSIHSNPHDFGDYLDIRIKYDDNDDIATQQAFFIEGNLPEKWSDESILLFVAEETD